MILNAGAYNNGTTQVVFEPLDFLARLAALVPRPRANLTRYHGVFAPNSPHCALVTRAGQGKCCERALAKSLVYCGEAFDDAKIGMAAAYATGDYTMQAIADALGVHYATVSRAVRGKRMQYCRT